MIVIVIVNATHACCLFVSAFGYYREFGQVNWKGKPPTKLSMPIKVLWGAHDDALSIDLLDAHKVLGDVRTQRIENSAHWVPAEASEKVAEQVLAFLNE